MQSLNPGGPDGIRPASYTRERSAGDIRRRSPLVLKMPAGVKKKQRRRYRNEPDSVTARFISDSSSDSDFEVRIPHVKYSEYKKKSRGCTSTEKSLCAVIVVFIVLCVVLAALLVAQFVLNVGAFKKQTCTSPNCVQVAGEILTRMSLDVNPCTNFYQFTCGGWLGAMTLPPDKASISMFTEVAERNTARMQELLTSEGNELLHQNSTAIRKVKDYYKACMNKKAVEDRGIAPMLELIKDLGSWTATAGESGTWSEETWNQFERLIAIHLQGSSPLFSMGVGVNLRNSDENVIQFDQAGLTFGEPTYYLDEHYSKKYYKAFRDYFATVTVLLGGDNATGYQIADDIWQFELKIANITKPREERQDYEKLYHKMTVLDLQNIVGHWINIADFLKAIFGYRLALNTEVVVYAPEFLGQIGDIVLGTSKRTLANYMVWHGMKGGLGELSYPFRQASLAFSAAIYGVSARPQEWKSCVDSAGGTLPQASGALFVEKYFSSTDKDKVEKMLDSIKDQFIAQVPTLTWMDEETKKKTIEKAANVGNMIGYPDMAKNPALLDAYYQEMVITDNDVFQNWKNVNNFYVKDNLKRLSKKPDKKEWGMAPNTVNAYYDPTTNQMVFPAGILQAPFYDPTFPMAVNYGAIGMVMGHELTHGFDNSGRQYDKDGNLKNWWQQESRDNFDERIQCLIDQYNQFTIGNRNVNGKLTQGENIADNGGVKISFRAYQKWLGDHGSEEESARLPALNMTESETFFLGFGQIWCGKRTPSYAAQALVSDPHSPPSYRVLGTLNNMQEFADTFHCRPGTPMNQDKKCVVW